MRTKLHPKTRKELFEKVVALYYKSEFENIGAYSSDPVEKKKQRQQLKARAKNLIQLWDDLKL